MPHPVTTAEVLLQQIADSADALKRNRGKRGFDVLQRLQRVPRVTVRIDEVEKKGVSKITNIEGGNVTQFPMPVYTPGSDGRGK